MDNPWDGLGVFNVGEVGFRPQVASVDVLMAAKSSEEVKKHAPGREWQGLQFTWSQKKGSYGTFMTLRDIQWFQIVTYDARPSEAQLGPDFMTYTWLGINVGWEGRQATTSLVSFPSFRRVPSCLPLQWVSDVIQTKLDRQDRLPAFASSARWFLPWALERPTALRRRWRIGRLMWGARGRLGGGA